MNKKIKLAAALGSLTTASIAITAFTLPQFNSLDTYLFRPTNWTQHFASKQAAANHLDNLYDENKLNELFKEEQSGVRVINTYLISAALSGIQNEYFNEFSAQSKEFSESSDTTAEQEYATIKEEFLKLISSHLVNAITTNTSNVYIPESDVSNSSVYSSSNWVENVSNYFRGSGDTAFLTSSQAFASLLDQSGIMFDYNGTNYDTVDQVIAAWMMDEGFASDSAFTSIYNHIRWEANGFYTDSNSVRHSFQAIDENNNQTDKDTFIAYAQEEFYNVMKQFEESSVTELTYTVDDWKVTADYENAKNAWINDPDNSVDFSAPLNSDLAQKTMGEAFGRLDNNKGIIDGPAEAFMPHGALYADIWQINETTKANMHMPNLSDKLNTNDEYAMLSMLAWSTLSLEGYWGDYSNFLKGSTNQFCGSDGSSFRNSTAWQNWESYAVFMGFDKIDIPVEDRPNTSVNTVNKWWEPDCEGIFVDNGVSGGSADGYINFFNDWFLTYFGYELKSGSLVTDMDWWYAPGNANEPLAISFDDAFVFTDKSNGGALEGKTMLRAMHEGGKSVATEYEYINDTTSSFNDDYWSWVGLQDFVYFWNNGTEYRGKDKSEAKSKLDLAIKDFIELQWGQISYHDEFETSYDIEESHKNVLLALDNSFKTTGYNSIDEARIAVEQLAYSNGDSIFTEVGTIMFHHDDHYLFDTTKVYYSIDSAMIDVNWDKVFGSKVSSQGETGSFSSLVEYSTDRVTMLKGFNDSSVDVIFNDSISDFADLIVNGYNFNNIDSSINNISVDISAFDEDDIISSEEFITTRISILFDNDVSTKTYWVETEEYTMNSEEQERILTEAREALIQYWKDYIGA